MRQTTLQECLKTHHMITYTDVFTNARISSCIDIVALPSQCLNKQVTINQDSFTPDSAYPAPRRPIGSPLPGLPAAFLSAGAAGRLCVVVATAQAGPVGNPLIKGPRSPWEPCCRSRQVSTRNSPSPQKPCVANSSQKRSILAAAACHRMEVFLPPAVWSLSDWPHRSVCSRVMVRWPHAVRLQLSESRWCWGGGRWSGKRSRP
mmetsp:Transcript_16396/g.46662  ORF Transcript_16396/g.46662 Transcript_16396/m.46662 type:complete len:204 (+) Transcript_16396:250-861(+)